MIDVGQGDSIFIQLPDGKNMLIDAGPRSAKQVVVDYIDELSVTKIDYLVLTHSDEDHCGGMVEVFNNFEVETIYRPFVVANNYDILPAGEDLTGKYTPTSDILEVTTDVYANFVKYAYNETCDGELSSIFVSYDGIMIVGPSENPYIIEFHNPPKVSNSPIVAERTTGYPTKYYGEEAEGKNAVSPIISLSYGSTSTKKFLFTGDANETSEADFISNLPNQNELGYESSQAVYNVSVLKVGHHGSATSSSQEFLGITKPDFAVISVGADNNYGHPTESTIKALNDLWTDEESVRRLLRTDINKNIVVGTTENGGLVFNLGFENVLSGESGFTVPNWVFYVVIGVFVVIIVVAVVIKIEQDKKRKRKKVSSNAQIVKCIIKQNSKTKKK